MSSPKNKPVETNTVKHLEIIKVELVGEKLDAWQKYLMSSRSSYFTDRKNSLGNEYFVGKQSWDSVFEREWAVIEERMAAGIGVDENLILMLGEDFFSGGEEILQELERDRDLEKIATGQEEFLTIYTFEDFIMLSNQGIFRDEVFLIDPQRKWKKKVREILSQYGFNNFDRMMIEGEWYIVVTR